MRLSLFLASALMAVGNGQLQRCLGPEAESDLIAKSKAELSAPSSTMATSFAKRLVADGKCACSQLDTLIAGGKGLDIFYGAIACDACGCKCGSLAPHKKNAKSYSNAEDFVSIATGSLFFVWVG